MYLGNHHPLQKQKPSLWDKSQWSEIHCLFLSVRIVSKQTTPVFLLFLYRFAMLLETLWNQNYSVYWVLFIMLILKPLMWYSNILLKLTKFWIFLFQKDKECTDGQKENKKIGRWGGDEIKKWHIRETHFEMPGECLWMVICILLGSHLL